MGSSGTGNFSDYSGTPKHKGSTGGGGNGGSGGEDQCGKAFSADLQDVEHCDYFVKHKACPPKGTKLRVAQKKRMVAETLAGEVVGNLATKLNYLAGCLKAGYEYEGQVTNSASGPPAASVSSDFAPTKTP